MCCCMIETSSVPPRKSSVVFGNLRESSENVRKMFEKVRLSFGAILDNLRKSSDIPLRMINLELLSSNETKQLAASEMTTNCMEG